MAAQASLIRRRPKQSCNGLAEGLFRAYAGASHCVLHDWQENENVNRAREPYQGAI